LSNLLTPSGRRSQAGRRAKERAEQADTKASGAALARARARDKAAGQEWSSQFAAAYFQGEIEQRLYDAGCRWRELHASYLRALEVRGVRSAAIEPSFGSAYDVDTERGQRKAKREESVVAQYDRVREKLSAYGENVMRAVHTLVIDEIYLPWKEQQDAKLGLRALAIAFGMMRPGELN
jgi:hypothetical protein